MYVDSDGESRYIGRCAHSPNTFSSSGIKNDADRAACRPGHYTGSEGSIAKAPSAFYRPSTEITRCIPLCYEAPPGIIALRFCSAIRRTITRNCVPERIRRPRSIETKRSSRVDRPFHSDVIYISSRVGSYFDVRGI